MEDRKLNEQESLELIARMIQNTRRNLVVKSGNIFLIWGYLCAVMALLIYGVIMLTQNPVWNWLWFLIPAIGYPIMYWQRKNEVRPVLTFTDKVLTQIWQVTGQYGIAIGILVCLYFQTMLLLLPLILILCSLSTCMTGCLIGDKWMRNSASFTLTVGIVMLSHVIISPYQNLQYLLFAICFIIMMVIPGHRLNREAGRHV